MTLKLKDYPSAGDRHYFEDYQEFTDTPVMRELLSNYNRACALASQTARSLVSAQQTGGKKEIQRAVMEAAHWKTVADTLCAVIATIRDGEEGEELDLQGQLYNPFSDRGEE